MYSSSKCLSQRPLSICEVEVLTDANRLLTLQLQKERELTASLLADNQRLHQKYIDAAHSFEAVNLSLPHQLKNAESHISQHFQKKFQSQKKQSLKNLTLKYNCLRKDYFSSFHFTQKIKSLYKKHHHHKDDISSVILYDWVKCLAQSIEKENINASNMKLKKTQNYKS